MEAQTLKGHLDFSQQIVVELLKYICHHFKSFLFKYFYLYVSILLKDSFNVYCLHSIIRKLPLNLLFITITHTNVDFFINIIKELATTSLVTPASTTINGIIESVIPANSILSILLSDIQVFSVSLLKSLSLNLESLASYFYDDKTAS